MNYAYKLMRSPIGVLTLVASDRGLAGVLWDGDDPSRVRLGPQVPDPSHELLSRAERQLAEYFEGDRKRFELPLDPRGTDFQRKVWEALQAIPFGETRSYGDVARAIGNPKAVRAVGAANRRNPLSIVAPCHRVIGASGALTGFAGGLEVKARLLELEARARV